MKILDRYVIGTFLVSLGIVGASMLGLALVIDLFMNVGDFLEASNKAGEVTFLGQLAGVGNYYLYKSFEYLQMLAAPTLMVAAAASLVRFNRTRELTGMKAAGISLYRIMWPIIACSLGVAGLLIVNQELAIPAVADKLARDPDDLNVQDQFAVESIRDEHNNVIYAPLYDPQAETMYSADRQVGTPPKPVPIPVPILLRNSAYETTATIEARRAVWNGREGGWDLEDGKLWPTLGRYEAGEGRAEAVQPTPVDFYATDVSPAVIVRYRDRDFYRYMSYGALRDLTQDPMRGNRRKIQVAMYQHMTEPVLLMLVLLLGLPFVAGREERNYFVSIGLAVALTGAVMIVKYAATAFGETGQVDPLMAAWFPVFVVLPASIVSMEALRT